MSSYKKSRRSCPPFVMIEKDTFQKKEWRELGRPAKLIYIYIKAKYNGSNNGDLKLTYCELKKEFASATISKALKELVAKKWIEKTKHGGLFRFYCLYKLTGIYDRIRGLNKTR